MRLKFYYKCIKFYVLSKIWSWHYDTLGKLMSYIENKVLEEMYYDKELDNFRDWYWSEDKWMDGN